MKKLIDIAEMVFLFAFTWATLFYLALTYITYRMPHFTLLHNLITSSIMAVSCACVGYACWRLLFFVDRKFNN